MKMLTSKLERGSGVRRVTALAGKGEIFGKNDSLCLLTLHVTSTRNMFETVTSFLSPTLEINHDS